jgi:hypothetical protein
MSKAKDEKIVTLKDTTARWLDAWEKFDSGEMPAHEFAQRVRAAGAAISTAKLRLEYGLTGKYGEDDVRLI